MEIIIKKTSGLSNMAGFLAAALLAAPLAPVPASGSGGTIHMVVSEVVVKNKSVPAGI